MSLQAGDVDFSRHFEKSKNFDFFPESNLNLATARQNGRRKFPPARFFKIDRRKFGGHVVFSMANPDWPRQICPRGIFAKATRQFSAGRLEEEVTRLRLLSGGSWPAPQGLSLEMSLRKKNTPQGRLPFEERERGPPSPRNLDRLRALVTVKFSGAFGAGSPAPGTTHRGTPPAEVAATLAQN